MALRIARGAGVRGLLLLLLAALCGVAHAAAGGGWSAVPSPSPGSDRNVVHALSFSSATDGWAVGEQYPGLGALVEHWNGSSWSAVPSPAVTVDPILTGVAAVSAGDAWAVGYVDAGGGRQTLIEHWDGSRWTTVPSADPGTDNTLDAVAAVSADDVWAVGYDASGSSSGQPLIEHWDGLAWRIVPSPAVAAPGHLRGLAVGSADDVWAVGSSGDKTLTEHWNGSAWSVVGSPSPSASSHYLDAENVLTAVAVDAAGDVWAVGTYDTTKASAAAYHTLVEHWNGTKWSLVSSPDAISGYATVNRLDGVAAASPTDVWAVGHSQDYQSPDQILIEHWNGSGWTIAPDPVSSTWNTLNAVTRAPAGALWAAGAQAQEVDYYDNPISPQTLIARR